jgi:hypothetical protein
MDYQEFEIAMEVDSYLAGYFIFLQGIFAHNPPIEKVQVSPLKVTAKYAWRVSLK